jgi:GNAT superfamily N-acetyltransferase
MAWTRFESDADVPLFIEAAVDLHRALFDRLPAGQRPLFFDGWLRLLNDAHAFVLTDGGAPAAALVTIPRAPDTHAYRWRIRTLACRDELRGTLVLPGEVDLSRSFVMPCPDGATRPGPVVAGATATCVQIGYARRLDDLDDAPAAEWRFRPVRRADVDPLIDLFGRAYAGFEDADPDLTRQREELREIVEHGGGWGWVATGADDTVPIAVASYIAVALPLAMVPAVLVGDLAVEPRERGRGLARALQRHAYRRLHEAGHTWVYGNIDPDNTASRRQAEAMERAVWYEAIRFHPDADAG